MHHNFILVEMYFKYLFQIRFILGLKLAILPMQL